MKKHKYTVEQLVDSSIERFTELLDKKVVEKPCLWCKEYRCDGINPKIDRELCPIAARTKSQDCMHMTLSIGNERVRVGNMNIGFGKNSVRWHGGFVCEHIEAIIGFFKQWKAELDG